MKAVIIAILTIENIFVIGVVCYLVHDGGSLWWLLFLGTLNTPDSFNKIFNNKTGEKKWE